KKLPELSRSLGQAVSEFRKGVTTATDDPPQPAPPVAASTAEITDSRQSSGPTVGEGAPTVNRTEPAQETPKQDHRPYRLSLLRGAASHALDHAEEIRELQGLRQVVREPGGQDAMPILEPRPGRQRDNGNRPLLSALVLLDPLQQTKSV